MPNFDETIFEDTLFRNKKKKSGYRIVDTPYPPLEAPIADTHAHLDMLQQVPLILARCAAHNLGFICSIVDIHEDEGRVYRFHEQWAQDAHALLPAILENTEKITGNKPLPAALPTIRAAVGCHPHHAKYYDPALEKSLLERLRDPLTCAVGEVGLDYHYDFSPREKQQDAFRRQIALANLCELPLILHLREAHEDALSIMDEEGFPQAGTLLHCYNLDTETLRPWLERDCFVAFGGPLTFKKSDETRAAAAVVAHDRLLTETDAPFMTPEPMRGMVCGPEHTIFTAEKLAEVCACEPGDQRKAFLTQVYDNAINLLDRAPSRWQSEAI